MPKKTLKIEEIHRFYNYFFQIDKNFEKYSDAVIEQKPDAIETITKTR